jgi:hypothetical protein
MLYLKSIALTVLIAFIMAMSPALSQNSNLPKTSFPRFTQQGGQMPSGGGVHLHGGMERKGNSQANQFYDPGEPQLNMQWVRWEEKKMPILIWISPGLKLPDCPFQEIMSTRVDMVFNMLKQKEPFLGMDVAPGWTEQTNYVVADGFEMWREFESEGLFKYGFTDDPLKAHILVFFTDAFRDQDGPGGLAVGGITSAQIYPWELAQRINIAQKPVIIELATSINSNPERMRAAAAHEFGHALGIKAHSPYLDDLMYVDRVVNELSPADKAVIRKLYKTRPKFVM